MADIHVPKHPYHLVDPSPWPIIGAVSALVLTGGGVMYLHGGGWIVMVIGFLGVLFTMTMWWRDVIREGNSGRYHTPIVRIGLRYGMALFIASEVMFFAAFFWAFFSSALYPTAAIGHVWPPKTVRVFDPWQLPFVNTLILLLSGVTVTWAHHALLENNRRDLIRGLAVTVFLGICFTLCQAYEYSTAGFGFTGGIYPSTFFMATGFHGFHVIIGTTFLTVCLVRAIKGDFTPQQHVGFEAAAWYWHFVDVVWLFLFCCIYWWGGAGGVLNLE
ncbi:MAG TPA: cytochrome c oxidase subunit 3 [Alphaproteobacteria bacterium]|nr:cytochrome c oxidase subunit 3 [Alphaproteobacteria bacterium]